VDTQLSHDLLGQRGWLDAAESAGRFLFNGLNVTREGEEAKT